MNDKGFSTNAIHIGEEHLRGALITPIYQTSTFVFDKIEEIATGGYVYTRVANPTQTVLEKKMAVLEDGEDCIALASGMAAITATILTSIKCGDHVVSGDVIYGCTYDLFTGILKDLGIEVTFVDASKPGNIGKAIKDNTKLIFLETPANPTMKLSDISAISEIGRDHGVKTIVDNTFMTPYFQKPLKLGADIVVHSATKYLCGHGDTLGGIIVSTADFIKEVRRRVLKDMGGAISPFNAWLLIKGLKTLGIRMDRHEKNAIEIAKFLESHTKVKKVLYPGLRSHTQFDLAKKQMKGFGGMLSFEMEDSSEAKKLLDRVRLCSLGVSLGSTETLIEHPYSMTHRSLPKREDLGITDRLIRLSVGIEDVEDIIADLEQALG